ncbi:MAG: hypothetical protein AAGC93_08635 [Cyanobacteria bacterium P01_F01_bin.53]
MSQAHLHLSKAFADAKEIKIMLDGRLCVHIQDGLTKVMTMMPKGYKPAHMQIYADALLCHESYPQKGIVTVNTMTSSSL